MGSGYITFFRYGVDAICSMKGNSLLCEVVRGQGNKCYASVSDNFFYKKSLSNLRGILFVLVQGRLITSNIIIQDLEEIGNFR